MSDLLPIYEAYDIINVMSANVGRNKPWVVLAKNDSISKSFVVKLFTENQVEHCNSVSKEIICNILAGEFGFSVPGIALINIPSDVVYSSPKASPAQFENADIRLKFATEEVNFFMTADNALPKYIFTNKLKIDTLYAFDNLIRNCDRGAPKPNLLLSKHEAYLIDHELALEAGSIEKSSISDLLIDAKFSRHHLMYKYLVKAKSKTKNNYFQEFEYYLSQLNISRLNPYFASLKQHGFPDYSPQIKSWLEHIRQNSSIFVQKLKESLQ